MQKAILSAALAVGLSLAAPQVMAGDTTKTDKPTDTKMNSDAKGAPSDQPAGAETSDRTPDKMTPTPPTQVDKTKEGATSDRTPEKK